ncbi:MAG: DUF4345 family protein [Alphaproteobacteria bacterium]|nr:DUF4345 family protein [Alphaproteobacteria bacterium]
MAGRGPLVVLWLGALVFVGFGVWGLVSPYGLLDAVGLSPVEAGAVAETRATYGGLIGSIGVALVVFAVRRPWNLPGLVLATLTFGGLCGGRLIGMWREGAWPPVQVGAASAEAVATVLAAVAWWAAARAAARAAGEPDEADRPTTAG